ncbi:MAG TPA: hypothetical protein PKL84_05965 [Candidatus Hydrogenedentes bacterium]|nr:hypothetical protein [Candidatus Hydrogenedentota bacterium]
MSVMRSEQAWQTLRERQSPSGALNVNELRGNDDMESEIESYRRTMDALERFVRPGKAKPTPNPRGTGVRKIKLRVW